MTKWNRLGLRSWLLGTAALALMGAGIVGSQFQHVNIVVQGPTGKRHVSIWTFGTKVTAVLHKAGIHFNKHDVISPANTVGAGNNITVREAIPVTVKTPTSEAQVWTTHYTVAAALALAQVTIHPLDEVTPARNAVLTGSTTINVVRRWWVTHHLTLKIPYAVHHQPDPNLAQGKAVVHTVGRPGKRVKTIRQLMQDGHAIKTVVASVRRVQPSRAEVIDYGTARPISRGGPVLQFTKVIAMSATAYWPDPAWSSGYTATGLKAQYGIAAVDPTVIPLGTRLYIPGYGFALAADVGGGIKGDRIDLCYNSLAQCETWGLRNVEVYVLGP